jgi:pimeloyl-ACP methyl ester carboxylesterase
MAKAMEEHSARDVLARIEVPTLVLAGAKDVMTPPQLAEEMAATIPDSRLEILPEGSHTLPIDDPDWVNPLVEGFVSEIEKAEAARGG